MKSLAAGLTTKVTEVLWLRLPLVPVIVNGYVPGPIEQPVDIVRVEDPEPPLMEAGLKLEVAPVGNPLTPNETLPVKPLAGLTVTV